MSGHARHRSRRPTVTAGSAALTALLAAATMAAPASAAPTCGGRPATIVGTAKGEVISGTPGADVIVARGGHDVVHGRGGGDRICGNGGNDKLVGGGGDDVLLGQTGRDKLFGGGGRDQLVGGPADDRLVGGPGNDACFQGSGAGLRIACERPPADGSPPPSAKVLAIAYVDLDGSRSFGTGDILISQLLDASGEGRPSAGDAILLDRYPLDFGLAAFGEWGQKSHTVTQVTTASETRLQVDTAAGSHSWEDGSAAQSYSEWATGVTSVVRDRIGDTPDLIQMEPGSPSQPAQLPTSGDFDLADNRLVEVELRY